MTFMLAISLSVPVSFPKPLSHSPLSLCHLPTHTSALFHLWLPDDNRVKESQPHVRWAERIPRIFFIYFLFLNLLWNLRRVCLGTWIWGMLPNDLSICIQGKTNGEGFLANSSIQNGPACGLHSWIHGKAQRNGLPSANLGVIIFHGSEWFSLWKSLCKVKVGTTYISSSACVTSDGKRRRARTTHLIPEISLIFLPLKTKDLTSGWNLAPRILTKWVGLCWNKSWKLSLNCFLEVAEVGAGEYLVLNVWVAFLGNTVMLPWEAEGPTWVSIAALPDGLCFSLRIFGSTWDGQQKYVRGSKICSHEMWYLMMNAWASGLLVFNTYISSLGSSNRSQKGDG